MVKIKFICVDGGENFLMPDILSNVDTSRFYAECEYLPNNRIPLSRLFNSVLDDSRTRNSGYDFIVFLHGDVSFSVVSFLDHLYNIKDKYDVIGLAGTKKMDVSHSPLNWFTSSHNFRESRFGDITMNGDGSEVRCFYNEQYNKNITDTRVACIDGLCIIIGKNVIDSEFRFNEGISSFDFYDTDISLQCNLKYKFRLGVMVEPTKHLSIGKSILTQQFLDSEKRFREVFDIPLSENKNAG